MSNQSHWIAAAVTTAVAALAMGQASAQNYGNSDYGHNNGNGYGHSRIVRCESSNSRRSFCRVDTRGEVRIARQISQRACLEGRTWGSNDRGIWVSDGCRADFAIRARRYDNHDNNNGYGDGDHHRDGQR